MNQIQANTFCIVIQEINSSLLVCSSIDSRWFAQIKYNTNDPTKECSANLNSRDKGNSFGPGRQDTYFDLLQNVIYFFN